MILDLSGYYSPIENIDNINMYSPIQQLLGSHNYWMGDYWMGEIWMGDHYKICCIYVYPRWGMGWLWSAGSIKL